MEEIIKLNLQHLVLLYTLCEMDTSKISDSSNFPLIGEDGYSIYFLNESTSPNHILVADSPSPTISRRWSEVLNANFSPVHNFFPMVGFFRSNAKKEASLRRERDDNGKFKKCRTKWIPATEFFDKENLLAD